MPFFAGMNRVLHMMKYIDNLNVRAYQVNVYTPFCLLPKTDNQSVAITFIAVVCIIILTDIGSTFDKVMAPRWVEIKP